MQNDAMDKLGSAILSAAAVSIMLCVFGIVLGANGDFRSVYLYFQAIGLMAMLVKGAISRETVLGFQMIIAALAICAAIDLWLGVRGPIYFD